MKLLMQKARDRPPRLSDVQGSPTQHREGRLLLIFYQSYPGRLGLVSRLFAFIFNSPGRVGGFRVKHGARNEPARKLLYGKVRKFGSSIESNSDGVGTTSDDEEATMPQGDKSKYTDKQKRKAEHIEEGYENRGVPEEEAEGPGLGYGEQGVGRAATSRAAAAARPTRTSRA